MFGAFGEPASRTGRFNRSDREDAPRGGQLGALPPDPEQAPGMCRGPLSPACPFGSRGRRGLAQLATAMRHLHVRGVGVHRTVARLVGFEHELLKIAGLHLDRDRLVMLGQLPHVELAGQIR